MIQNYILTKMDKNFVLNYFFRLIVINLFGLLFLYDTDSLNQGLISIQSMIYSINSLLTFLFLTLEFVTSILQFYGLDHKFLSLIFFDLRSIKFMFVFEIFLNTFNYVFFVILSFLMIFYKKFILQNIFKKNFIIFFFLLFIAIISINIDFSKKLVSKIYNLKSTFNEYSFFRNDNWFLYYTFVKIDSENKKLSKKLNYIDDISNLINPTLHKNIFIIINESYPNFKNQEIKKNLFNYIYDDEMALSLNIQNYVTNWSKKYSTQGAELKLFCRTDSSFNEFKKKDLKNFIYDNNCYFKNFYDLNTVFIHTYNKSSFNRERYDTFFDETFFFKDLKYKNLDICEGRPFTGYCDHQLVERLNEFKSKEKNLIIYLTVNNHVPVKLIKNINAGYCKKNFPLNINDQFCFIYQNQILFNKSLNKFINTLSKGDFLIYYSDTPPIFPNKHRVHFEDYIDVYTFEKK